MGRKKKLSESERYCENFAMAVAERQAKWEARCAELAEGGRLKAVEGAERSKQEDEQKDEFDPKSACNVCNGDMYVCNARCRMKATSEVPVFAGFV